MNAGEIVANIAPFQEHVAAAGLEQRDDHFHSGGFSGAVGAQVAGDLAGADVEANVIDDGDVAVILRQSFDFEHL